MSRNIEYRADGQVIITDARSVSDAKREAKEQVDFGTIARLGGTFWFGGKEYQLGADRFGVTGIANITSKAAEAALSLQGVLTWPAGFAWRAADNSFVAMNAAQMAVFGQAGSAYVTAVRKRAWVLNAAIDAAQTVAEVDAIDTAAGWPSNVMG
jgi:hypothetical protein